MNSNKLALAIQEAERFLKRANTLKKLQGTHDYGNPLEAGAVKRSSMDLTRALADLRKPN